MTDTIDPETGEVIEKPKKKKKKNSKKKPADQSVHKTQRAGSSIRDYIRDNPSEFLTTIAILMVDVDEVLMLSNLSEDFMS